MEVKSASLQARNIKKFNEQMKATYKRKDNGGRETLCFNRGLKNGVQFIYVVFS